MSRPPPFPCLSRLLRHLPTAALAWVLVLGAAKAAEPVKVGCVEFPPLTYTDANGRPAGKAIELVTAVLAHAGLPYEIKCYPGARLMANLRDGTSHAAMLIRHPDIVDSVLYGRMPMAYLELDGFRLARTPPLGAIENSRGKSVILLRGYGYGGWVDFFKEPANGMAVSYADSRPAALKMLLSGHGDYLIDYAVPATLALGDGVAPLQTEVLTRLETYFVVSRNVPHAERLLGRIEDSFRELGGKPVN
ncbi:MAG TPA: transporter substrate-binding domain-containing protein [Magnetospirillum sp.]|jgi:polar amino acid transport system substrate-binding protein|nr:transporter substrate-binding domain-containing protein [Magnetospirillum sp.]